MLDLSCELDLRCKWFLFFYNEGEFIFIIFKEFFFIIIIFFVLI